MSEMTTTSSDAPAAVSAADAAVAAPQAVAERIGATLDGLAQQEAELRLAAIGPNALRTHRARPLSVLVRQVRSPLLLLLVVTATVSFFVAERADAVIIGAIVSLSVGLGFFNEYRAERAAETLHSQLRPFATVRRDGAWKTVDVTRLVPGDVIRLELGSIIPADARIISATTLECDESVLTGESAAAEKTALPVATSARSLGELSSVVFMGTIVKSGGGEALVFATGGATQFGRIALGLGERHEETEFQVGLRRFSGLLARVAVVLTAAIFVINLVLQRPLIDALLFSLAIAVGITPQLLPAVVTTSLATGSRRLARRKVLVKRLVCIEDLGDIEVLLTDKTGTLTEGRITFERALDADGCDGTPGARLAETLGIVCNEATVEHGVAVAGNVLDVALFESACADAHTDASRYRAIASVPFDHDRRRGTVLADGPNGRVLITKGAPEGVIACCDGVPSDAHAALDREFGAGKRVVAVASRSAGGIEAVTDADETHLALVGFVVFLDPPKASAAAALRRLESLGVAVTIVTGDNPAVAVHVCETLGCPQGDTVTGDELDKLDEAGLAARLATTRVFARVGPEQKSRIIRAYRSSGRDVAYLGDGVNDAVALHHADVGISVDTATDVAKDAADIVLLEKDLDVLADGVVEGRRIFANTIKYVFMGTSSNFGNMFSAAAVSAFLSFLPMLPSQILLNNLLYDTSQLLIPTDRVDEEQLARPSHWDIAFIRRFMLFFGPISSLFDFLTFAILLHAFHAGPRLFRSGWFVESLATQCLVIFVIRTRRVPFVRSRPGRALLTITVVVVLVGAWLPSSPMSRTLGFAHLPVRYFALLAALVAAYLLLAELAKWEFYRHPSGPIAASTPVQRRRVGRRAARFSHGGSL